MEELQQISDGLAIAEANNLGVESIWSYGMLRATGLENNEAVQGALSEWDI